MKTLLTAALIALTLPAFAADAPAGKVLTDQGKVFSNNHGAVVRKTLKNGEKIDKHNHEGEDIVFSVMSGKITVILNDSEKHELQAGDTLLFNGKNFIAAEAGADDTTVVITLVKE
ncbi:MAG: cupin domain-containing protein [Cardiobacterium sp.]